ncbi:uncharacterized protein EI97DRAFT_431320 [Westerdykella ornata]|uniref:Uncharacterized protein n=1 Tax=Westerdykella ornata TaxID=318751 RepID=A0A6A6JS68_WESOR|nr:uncharacterized protein EI97DRAFT_431320 [Westerdykella ornata]KAF2279105.1 hypothetical protein EI97DRAFT_431320 [Westerdykella ornata]
MHDAGSEDPRRRSYPERMRRAVGTVQRKRFETIIWPGLFVFLSQTAGLTTDPLPLPLPFTGVAFTGSANKGKCLSHEHLSKPDGTWL